MKNLTIELQNRPGTLAEMGEILGRAGVSIEGGGAWVVEGKGIANFLFEDGFAAADALAEAGIRVLKQSEVVVQKLDQEQPGQLGKLLRRMAEARVNVEGLYSDHQHRLVLVVDDSASGRARAVSEAWTREQPGAQASKQSASPGKIHLYTVDTEWTGNTGPGTTTYTSYRRDHIISTAEKPPILGSSDPAFRGSPTRYNPEELLVAALSSCHMLSYLHLCAVQGVVVEAYNDTAAGTMIEGAPGRFTEVTLHPDVTIRRDSDPALALSLHEAAHHVCFIANSVNFPVTLEPHIILADAGGALSTGGA